MLFFAFPNQPAPAVDFKIAMADSKYTELNRNVVPFTVSLQKLPLNHFAYSCQFVLPSVEKENKTNFKICCACQK
jgi:hypothetical protein